VAKHPDEFRPLGGSPSLEEYANMVNEDRNLSANTFTSYTRALQRWYDCWRNFVRVTRGYRSKWNNIPIPFLHTITRTNMARKLDIHLGQDPWAQFIAEGPEDVKVARKFDQLILGQLAAIDVRWKFQQVHLNADLFGWSVTRDGMRTEYGRTYQRTPGRLASGVGGSVREVPNPRTGLMGITFNGPDFYVLDNSDFFPCPGYARVKEMPHATERYFMDFEDIVALSEVGPGGEPPVYFPDVVARMRYSGQNKGSGEEITERRNAAAGGVDDRTYLKITKSMKPVLMFDRIGRVPRGMAVTDPVTGEQVSQVIITVADYNHVLRVSPIDTWSRDKPWLDYHPLGDPRWFHTPSKIELGERLQWAINKWISRKADSLDAWIDPIILMDENADIDPNKFFAGPGSIVSANGPVDEKVIRQLIPDLRGIQITYQEVQQMYQWLQQVLGVAEDISFGVGARGTRESAQSAFQRARAVGVLLGLEAMLFEEQILEPICQRFVQYDRQYLPLRDELMTIGASAVWDVGTGTFVAPAKVEMSLDELNRDLPVRALGATRYITEQTRMQGVQGFLSVLGPLLPALNIRAFVRQVLPVFFFRNVDELVNTEEQMMQYYAMAAQASGKKNGGNGAGMGGTSLAEPLIASQALSQNFG
jgi:hypothetical protein